MKDIDPDYVFDEAEAESVGRRAARAPEHPGMAELAAAALKHDAGQYIKFVRHLPDVVRTLGGLFGLTSGMAKGQLGQNFAFGPRTPLNVAISGERGFAGVSLPIAALKQLAAAHDAKLNDVVLALCSGALRRWLGHHGGVPDKPLIAAMPISLRAPGNTEYTTQATMALVNLNTHLADPVRRLRAIRDAAGAVKALAGRAKVQTKRGCPFRCIYCTYPHIGGKTFRHVPPDEVARTARMLQEAGARYLYITDSTFNGDYDHSLAVALAFKKAGITVPWGAFFAPIITDRDYFRALADAGLRHVEFGSESLSDSVLKAYRKPFRAESVFRAHAAAVAAGLPVAHYILFGGPGENSDTVDETLGGIERLDACVLFLFCGMRIYPQTALESLADSRALRWWVKASSTVASRPSAASISRAPSPRKRHPISGEK